MRPSLPLFPVMPRSTTVEELTADRARQCPSTILHAAASSGNGCLGLGWSRPLHRLRVAHDHREHPPVQRHVAPYRRRDRPDSRGPAGTLPQRRHSTGHREVRGRSIPPSTTGGNVRRHRYRGVRRRHLAKDDERSEHGLLRPSFIRGSLARRLTSLACNRLVAEASSPSASHLTRTSRRE